MQDIQDTEDNLEYQEELSTDTTPYRKYTSKAYRELIKDVAEASGYGRESVKDILNCLSYCVAVRMTKGLPSQIDNMGTFEMRVYQPRIINLPAHYRNGRVKPGKILAENIVNCKFTAANILKYTMKQLRAEQLLADHMQELAENKDTETVDDREHKDFI